MDSLSSTIQQSISAHERIGGATTLYVISHLPTHPKEGSDAPGNSLDTEETQLSEHQDLNIKFPEQHTEERCKPPENKGNLDDNSFPDPLNIYNNLADDEGVEPDTLGYMRPWGDHDRAHIQAESEIV
jgi:hypothetical protein